ncbi:hypothetical protein MMC16_007381 [Acarospora aff. strigata]|nr:hypothetical protein [Acarospora aff. strigata]
MTSYATAQDLALGSILVTGGCGFLGSHIVRLLLDDRSCSSVSVLSRNPTSPRYPKATYHTGDITDAKGVRSILAQLKPSVIIHTVSPRNTDKASVLEETNVTGTQILLRCASENTAVQAFVFTSTDSAIVPSSDTLDEETAQLYDERSRVYAYAKTKAIADAMVLKANSPALRTAVLRIPGIYGEGDTNMIPRMLSTLRKGQQKVQVGNNKKLFEFCYVKSAASAHILAAKALLTKRGNPSAPKVDGEAFFITDGTPTPFWDFARKIFRAAGDTTDPEDVKVLPLWLMLVLASVGEWVYWVFTLGRKEPEMRRCDMEYFERGCVFSIEKARSRLGYKALVGMDEGVRRGVEWALRKERGEEGSGEVKKKV